MPDTLRTSLPPSLRRALRDGVLSALVVMTIIAACIWVTYDIGRNVMRESLDEQLSAVARIAAISVDPKMHAQLTEPDQLNGPLYLEAVAPLRRLLDEVPEYKYIYTVRMSDAGPVFVLDAALPIDLDGDGVIDQAGLGEPVEEIDAAMRETLTEAQVSVSPEPFTDKWGTFVSGFAPVFTADGSLECIVGVDSDASVFFDRLSRIRRSALIASALGLFTSVLVGTGVGIIQYHRVLGALDVARSERRFRTMADSVPVTIWLADVEGSIIDVNEAGAHLFGRPREGILGDGWANAVHPEDLEQAQAAYLEAIRERRQFTLRYRIVHPDGTVRHIEDHGTVRLSDRDEIEGFAGGCLDVTDQYSATTDARQLAAAIDAHTDAVMLMDAQGRITRVNRAFERLTGRDRSEAIGCTAAILQDPSAESEVGRELLETITSGRPWTGRLSNRRRRLTDPDHHAATHARGDATELYWVDVSITPLTGPNGQIEGYVSVQRDVTELVKSEAQERRHLEAAELKLCVTRALNGTGTLRDRAGEAVEAILSSPGFHAAGGAALIIHDETSGTVHPLVATGVIGRRITERLHSFDSDLDELLTPQTDDGDRLHRVTITDRTRSAPQMIGVLHVALEGPIQADDPRSGSMSEIGDMLATALLQDRATHLAEHARVKAEEAVRTRGEFLANMSHEIRTPLTAVLGYADLLRDETDAGTISEAHRETIETIRRAGEHLMSVINDVLDFSKIEAGEMHIESIETNLHDLLGDIRTLMGSKARAKDLDLELTYRRPIPGRILSDPTRLRQILLNLVGNAIKFTDRGSVNITIDSIEQSNDRLLIVQVQDTGPGMTAAQAATLFRAFSQADTTITRRHGGTGLGLTISRRLARLMGGDLLLESTAPCEGSCFTLTVPLRPVDQSAPDDQDDRAEASTVVEPREAALKDRRILLAEDGPDNQRLISHILRRAGATVDIAPNGRIALDLMQSAIDTDRPYDLLISDMQMPEMDGYTLVSHVRARGITTPIIALTAHVMAEDRARCLACGCDEYLPKPIDRTELIAQCRNWIGAGAIR